MFIFSHLAIGGGIIYPSQLEIKEHTRARRKSLSARLLLPCALCLVFATAIVGCADEDIPEPKPQPLMTRADSIAAGLLPAVPTADGAWDSETYYDFDGNPIGSDSAADQLGVGGVDSDLDSPWGE